MFAFSYLIVMLVAALPLMRTIVRRRDNPPSHGFVHRISWDLAYVAAAVAAIALLETMLTISLEDFWFSELDQRYRYWLALGLQVTIFAVVLVFGGLFIAFNLRVTCRPVAVIPRSVPWIVGFAIATVIAFGAAGLWTTLVAFLGAAPSGVTDPVFDRDLSFYLLALPLYEDVVYLGLTILIITIAACASIAYLLYPRAALPWRHHGGFPAPIDEHSSDKQEAAEAPLVTVHRIAWDGCIRQAMALGALVCLASAAARYFDRFHLVIGGHSTVVAGASFVDIHYWLPAYTAVIAGWVAAAIGLAAAACLPGVRRWLLAAPLHWVVPCGLFAAVYLGAAIIPMAVEQVYVGPNQITLEQPYLLRSIAGTRQAYGLDGPDVEEQEFAVSATPLGREDLERNAATLREARIWDWRALEPQLQQIQGLRPYYTFGSVVIDRYQIDGAKRQVMITARELDVAKLPTAAQVWVNLALKYTHGYGIVAVPVNEIDGRGNPVLWAHDIPVKAKGELAVTHGELYYGIQTRDRVYVHTTEKEFDFPRGDANAETTYGGKGGIPLSSIWRKLVVAREFDGMRLFISGYFTPQSRVLMRRNVVERVSRLAPFLTFDHDPYIVADGDHYSYIIDGYTSSGNYPYSETYRGSLNGFRDCNYLRNSVKAVVDAYNGSVTFYVFGTDDPIIKAYRKMLPRLFRDHSEMPDNLRRHIRYPEDLFTIQADMYGTYHMTNPTTFYNREDRWEVPRELFRDREIEVRPYYVMAELPRAGNLEFLLMLPLSVAGKNQMAGWLAGRSDAENYGKLVAFRFPKGRFVDGPAQIESRINSDSRFSGDLTLWDQHGSRVIRGNLLILPLNGNQLIAIEPVYIEAEQTRIPTLARVVFGQLLPDDRKIEWGRTLGEAESLLVGLRATETAGPAAAGIDLDRLARARAVFHDMQKEYAAGNFVRYGELLQQLEKMLLPP